METFLTVHSLHALAYCERLFYLEEIEKLKVADERVYAGRRLHVELERDEDGDWQNFNLESQEFGLVGKFDALRQRGGETIPYEHKRGRSARGFGTNTAEVWQSDKIQIVAYAALLEEHLGIVIKEGRVRYHADNVTVRVPIDDKSRLELVEAVARARTLQNSLIRPPVADNEKLCVKCSLAPVCLPEEARLAETLQTDDKKQVEPETPIEKRTLRLFPADDNRQTLHVITNGAKIGRKGDRLEVWSPDSDEKQLYPIGEIGQVALHGFSQITTQALSLCATRNVGVHWISYGGRYMGAWTSGVGSVQRRIRQYQALTNPKFCLELARRLAETRVRGQLSFLLRAQRENQRGKNETVTNSVVEIRKLLSPLARAANVDSLRGFEGMIAAYYFEALPHLIISEVSDSMRPNGRNRRPPKDRANALLSFGYALLLKDITNAILVVGLDPSLGFYHTPRSQAHPLALDLMELFRVPLIDLPIIASINRKQWDVDKDFQIAGEQVWLSDTGRRKLIAIYEKRKTESWKHPVIGYSLSYSRLIELEVRLLEKEWTESYSKTQTSDEPRGLFAKMRLR